MLRPRRFLALLLAWPVAWASATAYQPVDSIREAALAAVGGEGEASLDPALRMPACAAPLQGRQSTASTVEVSCPGGWRLYVPVRQRRSQQVVVPSRTVAGGETPAMDAVSASQRDASRVAVAPLSDPAAAVGHVGRLPLHA